MHTNDDNTTDRLSKVKSDFDHWRNTRIKKTKIPVELWEKVRLLIDYYPTRIIKNALGLSSQQIRDNLDLPDKCNFASVKISNESNDASKQISSFTSNQDHHTNNKTCSLELRTTSGQSMIVNNYPTESVATIITQLMR